MTKYLSDVLRTRNQSDLQSTRDQISRCFEAIQCFLLPHPGRSVTKKTWDGEVETIDEFFRVLVNKFVRIVFDKEIQPKEINHRKITAGELMAYFEVYVSLFQTGQKSFPQAMTMLQATAEANNRNAFSLAINHYKKSMEVVAGNDKEYIKDNVSSFSFSLSLYILILNFIYRNLRLSMRVTRRLLSRSSRRLLLWVLQRRSKHT